MLEIQSTRIKVIRDCHGHGMDMESDLAIVYNSGKENFICFSGIHLMKLVHS
jgi:hypothetical protein